MPHYPLWWEDPFEDKGDEDGKFAWTWMDYFAMPYSLARWDLNTVAVPVSAGDAAGHAYGQRWLRRAEPPSRRQARRVPRPVSHTARFRPNRRGGPGGSTGQPR